MNLNHTDQQSDHKLKERMSFAKMFKQQEQQIKKSSHITNLLKPTTNLSQTHEPLSKELLLKSLQEYEKKIHKKFILPLTLLGFAFLGLIINIFNQNPSLKSKSTFVQDQTTKTKQLSPKQYYTTTKFLNLRTKASIAANKITTLAPNTIVKILKTQNQWHYISAKDYTSDTLFSGWVYGENIKEVKKLNF